MNRNPRPQKQKKQNQMSESPESPTREKNRSEPTWKNARNVREMQQFQIPFRRGREGLRETSEELHHKAESWRGQAHVGLNNRGQGEEKRFKMMKNGIEIWTRWENAEKIVLERIKKSQRQRQRMQ